MRINNKNIYRYIWDKRKMKENVGPLQKEIEDLVTQYMEKAEVIMQIIQYIKYLHCKIKFLKKGKVDSKLIFFTKSSSYYFPFKT